MGRFSPTVLPDYGTDALAAAFARTLDTVDRRRRQSKLDTEHAEDRARAKEMQDLSFYERGGRRGAPPAEDARSVTLPGEFDIPDTLDFGLGPTRTPAAASPLETDAFSEALGRELQRGGPTGSGARASTSPLTTAPNFSDAAPSNTRTPASRHPGAFDPASRTFGGAPAQFATTAAAAKSRRPDPWSTAGGARTESLGPTGRYTVMDDDHYIDETATPAAERAAEREQQTLLSAALRGDDVLQRATQQIALERARQEGRIEAQRERDGAAATRSSEHDQRIAALQKELADIRANATSSRDKDRDGDRRDAEILRSARNLTKETRDPVTGLSKAGVPWDKAVEQATREVDAVLTGGARTSGPPAGGQPKNFQEIVATAVQRIRNRDATLEQLKASGASKNLISAVERQIGAQPVHP
jgi:hypothetical protein